jgi:hypothetical protein
MPLLFSYGTLQQEGVQLATLGRTLDGHRDELIGFAPSRVKIDDARVAATLGMTHHANVTRSTDEQSRVAGMVFEVTEEELVRIDEYEAPFCYARLLAPLAAGGRAWVYAHTQGDRRE